MGVGTEETPVVETETPPGEGEGAPEQETTQPDATPLAEAEVPAEGAEPKPEDAKVEDKPKEIPEEELRAAAMRWANKTMAAARRADKAAETARTENTALKSQLDEYRGFVADLQAGKSAALNRIGFSTVKAWLDKVIEAGGEPSAPTQDDRVASLEKLIRDRDAAEAKTRSESAIQASKTAVAAAIAKDERFDLASTDLGQSLVWEAIEAYNDQHGNVPDAAVFAIAARVEAHLEAQIAKSRKFTAQRPGEKKQGATAAASSATAARTSGNTLTNSSTAGAPGAREYSMDPDERRKQVEADMRAAGEL